MPGDASEWAAALEQYNKRLDDKPRDFNTLSNRSFVLLRLERLEEALQDAELCVSIAPKFPKGHTRAAQAHEKLGSKGEAIRSCLCALRLDPSDVTAQKVFMRLDETIKAGLQVLKQLREDAMDRRSAVRAALGSGGDIFCEKWAMLSKDERKTLIRRVLARAMTEVRGVFVEHFEPVEPIIQGERKTMFSTLPVLQEELLAVNIVLVADLLAENITSDDGDAKGEDRPAMYYYILAAAQGTENEIGCCGAGMHAMIEAYLFAGFRFHPDAGALSLELAMIQRSTMCLVVSHLLLGGDGLPTLSKVAEAFEEETTAEGKDSDEETSQEEASAALPESSIPAPASEEEYSEDEQETEDEEDDDEDAAAADFFEAPPKFDSDDGSVNDLGDDLGDDEEDEEDDDGLPPSVEKDPLRGPSPSVKEEEQGSPARWRGSPLRDESKDAFSDDQLGGGDDDSDDQSAATDTSPPGGDYYR